MLNRWFPSALLLLALSVSSQAFAQYNLRAVPGVPSAGAGFQVVFDDDECEIFLLQEPGVTPAVVVQGSNVRVEVDRAPVIDCSSEASTYAIPVTGLPAGNYTLQLIGRVFESPGTEGLLQTVALQVSAPVFAAPATIPANIMTALALLAAFLALSGCLMWWRRA